MTTSATTRGWSGWPSGRTPRLERAAEHAAAMLGLPLEVREVGESRPRAPARADGGMSAPIAMRAALLPRRGHAASCGRPGAGAARPGRGAGAAARQRRLQDDLNVLDGTVDLPSPVVPGHEGAGVVEALGEGVSGLEVGDHVALSWAPYCGHCEQCLRDLPHLCGTAWPVMLAGGMLDGTDPAALRRRGGAPLLLPLHVRRARGGAGPLLRPDLAGGAVRGGRAAGLCRHQRRLRGVADGRRAARRAGCRARPGRHRPVGGDGRGRAGAVEIVAVDRREERLDAGRAAGREAVVPWRGRAGADRRGRGRGQRRRRRLRLRVHRAGRPPCGRRSSPPASAGRGRDGGHPPRRRRARAAGAVDPADGAACARARSTARPGPTATSR